MTSLESAADLDTGSKDRQIDLASLFVDAHERFVSTMNTFYGSISAASQSIAEPFPVTDLVGDVELTEHLEDNLMNYCRDVAYGRPLIPDEGWFDNGVSSEILQTLADCRRSRADLVIVLTDVISCLQNDVPFSQTSASGQDRQFRRVLPSKGFTNSAYYAKERAQYARDWCLYAIDAGTALLKGSEIPALETELEAVPHWVSKSQGFPRQDSSALLADLPEIKIMTESVVKSVKNHGNEQQQRDAALVLDGINRLQYWGNVSEPTP